MKIKRAQIAESSLNFTRRERESAAAAVLRPRAIPNGCREQPRTGKYRDAGRNSQMAFSKDGGKSGLGGSNSNLLLGGRCAVLAWCMFLWRSPLLLSVSCFSFWRLSVCRGFGGVGEMTHLTSFSFFADLRNFPYFSSRPFLVSSYARSRRGRRAWGKDVRAFGDSRVHSSGEKLHAERGTCTSIKYNEATARS